jgi:hypothetical protein
MVKIKLGVDVTLHDEYGIETEDYEVYKHSTIDEIIACEKAAILDNPAITFDCANIIVNVKVADYGKN